MSNVSRWLRAASRREIVVRSVKVSLVVGTILVGINYGDRMMQGEVVSADYLKMALTYLVPYGVTTYAAVSTLMSGDRPRSG